MKQYEISKNLFNRNVCSIVIQYLSSDFNPALSAVHRKSGVDSSEHFLLLFYFLLVIAVIVSGWFCVGLAVSAYRRREYVKLRKGWRTLKYASIPFYVINFLCNFRVWFV